MRSLWPGGLTRFGQGQTKEAVKLAVQNPPTASKNEETQKTLALAAVAALKSANKATVKQVVGALTPEEADVAIKYVFKGMETQAQCDTLLEWHSQLYEKFGVACIVRAISERSPCPAKLAVGEA